MPLSVNGILIDGPAASAANPRVLFEELGTTFKLDKTVVEVLIMNFLTSLEEFCQMINNDTEVEAKATSPLDLGDAHDVQTARVKQAWHSVQIALQKVSANSLRKDDCDIDTMLSQPELDNMHARFWMRYKVTFSADVMVSDQVLSRLAKELSRRQLTVADLGKLKTLYNAICSDKKRKRVAVNLYFEEESDLHNTTNTDVHVYLAAMYSLCIGLAVAGSQSISSDKEPRGSDTTKFVECPLDILLRYHHRAAVAARALPYRSAITWLRERDIAERAIWVDKHRQTQQSLGVIIKDTYQETASLWVPPPNLKVQGLQAFQPI